MIGGDGLAEDGMGGYRDPFPENDGGFWSDILGIGGSILGSGGFWSGLGEIGKLYNANQVSAANNEQDLTIAREGNAAALERLKLQLAAQGGGAGAAAASADRRQKLAALMDASGRRIDANFTGTGQKITALGQMMQGLKGLRR